MPTVEKKYAPDVREGRKDFQGNHEVYEMPEKNKPRKLFGDGVHTSPRTVMTILLLLLFIVAIGAVIIEIMKRSQGFA
ncbi:MAG: hypothetical protein WD926_02010 [Patescibacteria group bacterium]